MAVMIQAAVASSCHCHCAIKITDAEPGLPWYNIQKLKKRIDMCLARTEGGVATMIAHVR